MTPAKPNPAARFLPSLTDVAFLLPALFLFTVMQGARTLLSDGDTGWHVRTGEWMLQNGRVPHTDLFSYTMAGRPWFAWEWLWDLCFGWLHEHWGLAAVVAASLLVLCLTFALLFRLVCRRCENRFLAIGVTTLAAAGASIHYLARPHLFTFLFVVVFLGLLEQVSEGRTRLLWWLPVLMVIWTNVHGGFLVGLFLVAAYAAGNFAAWLLDIDAERRRVASKRCKIFLAAGAGCFAATFVNPYFYHLHVHIFRYLQDPFLYQNVQEFQPLSFGGPIALFAEPMFVLAILAAAWTIYRRRFVQAILLLVWAQAALFAVRNLPIFLLIAAPIAAELLEELLHLLRGAALPLWIGNSLARFERTASEFGAIDRLPRVPLAGTATAAVLAGAFFLFPSAPKLRAEYDPSRYPAKALAVLHSPESQRIFTQDQWGDYLIYNLYPKKKVFVDGRSDFYGTTFDEKYVDTMRVKYGWEQNLNRYAVDTILLPVDEPLTGALKQSRNWRVVYDDGVAIVFRPVRPPSKPALVMEQAASAAFHKEKRDAGMAAARGSHRLTTELPKTRS